MHHNNMVEIPKGQLVSGTDAAPNRTEGAPTRYSVPQVARLLGLSERAVRKRIDAGTLRAERAGRQWWIPLEAVPGSEPCGTEEEPERHLNGATEGPSLDQARRQLEAIRDERLMPLVRRNGELERRVGRLEAENDELRARLAAVETSSGTDDFDAERPTSRAWWKFWERS